MKDIYQHLRIALSSRIIFIKRIIVEKPYNFNYPLIFVFLQTLSIISYTFLHNILEFNLMSNRFIFTITFIVTILSYRNIIKKTLHSWFIIHRSFTK